MNIFSAIPAVPALDCLPLVAAIEPLPLISRIAHIITAVLLGGGVLYMLVVLLGPLKQLPEEQQQSLRSSLRRRWAPLVGVSTLVLIASGLYNFIVINRTYDLPKVYHMLFGIKFLLALAVFALASMLVSTKNYAATFRNNAPFWTGVVILIGSAIVLIAGYMKVM